MLKCFPFRKISRASDRNAARPKSKVYPPEILSAIIANCQDESWKNLKLVSARFSYFVDRILSYHLTIVVTNYGVRFQMSLLVGSKRTKKENDRMLYFSGHKKDFWSSNHEIMLAIRRLKCTGITGLLDIVRSSFATDVSNDELNEALLLLVDTLVNSPDGFAKYVNFVNLTHSWQNRKDELTLQDSARFSEFLACCSTKMKFLCIDALLCGELARQMIYQATQRAKRTSLVISENDFAFFIACIEQNYYADVHALVPSADPENVLRQLCELHKVWQSSERLHPNSISVVSTTPFKTNVTRNARHPLFPGFYCSFVASEHSAELSVLSM